VPPHIHPTQDEFIYMLEGTFDLYLDGAWTKAGPGDLVRMPKGLPHGYYNKQDKPARALFSVSPARRLRELFDQLHNLTDPQEVVRRSKICEVDFLPPGSVPGA
jgi:quercetin dioxygenase-like cupin family protein